MPYVPIKQFKRTREDYREFESRIGELRRDNVALRNLLEDAREWLPRLGDGVQQPIEVIRLWASIDKVLGED